MKVTLGVSNHHVHLNEEDFKILFGDDIAMEKTKDLKQPGQFASNLKVDVSTEKNTIRGLRVLGPLRNYTQVEVSKTDCYLLGIDAPVRESGNLDSAAVVKIVGPVGVIEKPCAIIANRHIHIDSETRHMLGLSDTKYVKVIVEGEKGGAIDFVYLKESEPAYFELHLDTDDANCFLLKNEDELEIIK